MTTLDQDKAGGRRWRFPVGHFVAFVVLTGLNALFWLIADFGSFHPPSDGALKERLFFFGLTEAGPLAFFRLSTSAFGRSQATLLALAVVVVIVLAARFPKKEALQILGYLAMLFWFFFGFCVAGVRIT